VYITTARPSLSARLPPTPENTPPRPAREPVKAARVKVKSKMALKSLTATPTATPHSELADGDEDTLPTFPNADADLLSVDLVREVQYGLRSSRSSSRSRG